MFDEVRNPYGCAVDISSTTLQECRRGRSSRRRQHRRGSSSDGIGRGRVSVMTRDRLSMTRGDRFPTPGATEGAMRTVDGKEEGSLIDGGVASVQLGLSFRLGIIDFNSNDPRKKTVLNGNQHVGLKSGSLSCLRVCPEEHGRGGGDEEEEEGVTECDAHTDWRGDRSHDPSHSSCQELEKKKLPPVLKNRAKKRLSHLDHSPVCNLDDGFGEVSVMHSSSSCSSVHDRCVNELGSDGGVEQQQVDDDNDDEEEDDDEEKEEKEDDQEEVDRLLERGERRAVDGDDVDRTIDVQCCNASMATSIKEEDTNSELGSFENEFKIRTKLDWGDDSEDSEDEDGSTFQEFEMVRGHQCPPVQEGRSEGQDEDDDEDDAEEEDKDKDQEKEEVVDIMQDSEVENKVKKEKRRKDNSKEKVVDHSQETGRDEEEPKSPPTARPIWSPQSLECPDAPYARRCVRRANMKGSNKELWRQSSLTDTKLLLTTHLKRNASSFFYDKHFEYLHEIGRGSFSTVYEARDLRSRGVCAVKKSKRQFRGKEDRERYVREIQSVADLAEHPNVVKYFRGWQQDSYFYIQMELCEGGSLRDHLDSLTEVIDEAKVWCWIRQVASGLEHIHANGVLHLDIKPDNIFIDSQGTLKIGDFGLAVLGMQWDWEEGDGAYVAPELLRGRKPGPEADMYSFGAMAFEWASGEKLPRSWAARQEDIKLPTHRSPALNRLVQSLLQWDNAMRPRATAVLNWER